MPPMPPLPISPEGSALAEQMIEEFFARHEEMTACRAPFAETFKGLVRCFQQRGTLFLCGNGGSYADCMHISGELVKTFERQRPLPPEHAEFLANDPVGKDLASELQIGLRAVPLGLSGSLVSAIWNDSKQANIHYAQELYAMGNAGDVLLAISTSGAARNVLYAMAVARMLGVQTVALTGPNGGPIAEQADIALRLPGEKAWQAQEAHLPLYHLLCRCVEVSFFPIPR